MDTAQIDRTTMLGTILVSHGVISKSQALIASRKQMENGKRFGEVVQDLGMATVSQVNAALTDQAWRRRNGDSQ